MLIARFCTFVILAGLACSSLSAQEWSRFRGPNGSGIAGEVDIPSKLTDTDINWKVKLPGSGHSSPSIWGDRLFVLSGDPQTAERFVSALDARTGDTLWLRKFTADESHLHNKNNYAACTPAVDEDHLYVAWADDKVTKLVALNHDGETVWESDLGPWVSQHGFGTSPMIYEDKVIVSLMQLGVPAKLRGSAPGKSRLVALDRKTGDMKWQVARDSDVAAYSVPCIYSMPDGKDVLICNSSAHGIAAHDPETGKELWSQQVFNMRSVSSTVVAGKLLLGSCGSGGGGNSVSAVDPNGGQPKIAWQLKSSASYVPTPVTYDDKVFVWYDKGIVSCLDAKSGEVLGKNRIGGNYYGSPIRAGDRLFCISEDGELVVMSADEKLEVLGRTQLGEGSEATPSVAGGTMYLRTYTHLISAGGK